MSIKNIISKQFFIDYNNKLSMLRKRTFEELEKFKNPEKNEIKNKIFVEMVFCIDCNHFLCDFNKGIKYSSNKKLIPKVLSLNNSIETITAISNDINYNQIFNYQLENYSEKGDVLVVISSSGKSKNIINAVKYAFKNKLNIISFIGFGNNKFIKIASNHYINLNLKNYGITEDIFQAMMHMISQYLRKKNSKNKSEIF